MERACCTKQCRRPPAGGLGVSPNSNLPQDWGIEGVEKGFCNSLEIEFISNVSDIGLKENIFDHALSTRSGI